jgi:ABC-type transporter Mla subunit MlaD
MMSLGPPFDNSGIRLQQAVGAVVLLLLGAAISWVLLMSGRTVGRGLTVNMEMKSPGALRVGAKVRLAGREIGEVRGMTSGKSTVDIQAFVLRDWAGHVRNNSQFFVASSSVLGEAYLEVGPPRDQASPGPPVTDGERVRGADPPEIDDLLAHSERNLRTILGLLRESRPEMDELLKNGDSLLTTLSGLPADPGQMGRIRDQFVAALDSGASLLEAARQAGGVERVKKIARDLGTIADTAGPELSRLGARLETAMARFEQMAELFSPERRAQLERAMATFRKTVAIGENLMKDVRALTRLVESGRGAVGAFLADKELFDDLHETHRILKSQPWTLILKPVEKPAKKR